MQSTERETLRISLSSKHESERHKKNRRLKQLRAKSKHFMIIKRTNEQKHLTHSALEVAIHLPVLTLLAYIKLKTPTSDLHSDVEV